MTTAMTLEANDEHRERSASGADADRPATDGELVARLRSGGRGAYAELWTRHVAVALRVARRVSPGDAEDVVSEAFLAVHRQIVERGSGPAEDFRAYLLATVRNTAARRHRDAARLPIDDEGEPVDELDGLALVEREDGASTVQAAFRALPARWRRVLWLAEVERVGRSEIAARFGIRPNAVSVLHRRAKDGLRVEWLRRHAPESLLLDAGHVAPSIPAVIIGTATTRERARTAEHLDRCARCRELDRDLRAVSGIASAPAPLVERPRRSRGAESRSVDRRGPDVAGRRDARSAGASRARPCAGRPGRGRTAQTSSNSTR